MLFFSSPASEAATDFVVDQAVDGMLLNGMIMPKPSELEQAQRNQQAEQLQRQLAIMEQQLQQQIPACGSDVPLIQPNVPNLMAPFSGLLTSGTHIGHIESICDNNVGTPTASCIVPLISGISSIRPVSDGSVNTFTQLTSPIGLQQHQHKHIDHNQNMLLQSSGLCSACHRQIVEQSFLLVDGQRWHSECCVCVICGQNLEKDGPTCFVRNGFLLCHHDYFAKFGNPCERCGIPIARGELVMKVPKNGSNSDEKMLFHVQCFSCVCCGQMLSFGQQFTVGTSGQPGGALFCNAHFHLNPSLTFDQFSHKMSEEEQLRFLTQICSSNLGQSQQTNRKVFEQISTGPISPNNSQTDSRYSFMEPGKENPESVRLSSPSVTPTNGTDAFCSGQNGGSSNGGGTPLGGANGRQKRMRTSFKHHQLRTMKSYFNCNHNPDAKDLKQLSQKTGLTKRVLQVWFQNARAKYRRNQQIRGEMVAMDGPTPSLVTAMAATAHIRAASAAGPCSASIIGGDGGIHSAFMLNRSVPPPLNAADLPPVPLFVSTTGGMKANSVADSPNGSVSMGPRSMGTSYSSASSFSSSEERNGVASAVDEN